MAKLTQEEKTAANQRIKWSILFINSVITLIMGQGYLYGELFDTNIFVGVCLSFFGVVGTWISLNKLWDLIRAMGDKKKEVKR